MPRFAGWLRAALPGARPDDTPWLHVCEADDWRLCWDLLLAVPTEAQFVERLVTEKDHPNHRERPR